VLYLVHLQLLFASPTAAQIPTARRSASAVSVGLASGELPMSTGDQWDKGPARSITGQNPALFVLAVYSLILGGIEIFYCGRGLIGGAEVLGFAQVVEKEGAKQGAKAVEAAGAGLGFLAGLFVFLMLIGVALAVLRILSAIGILTMGNWGRTLAIVVAAFSIVVALMMLTAKAQENTIGMVFLVMYGVYIVGAFGILLTTPRWE
jgi:hypothetical protein